MDNKYAYMVVVAASMMCEGSMAAIIPTVTLQKFGITRGHDVFAIVYSSYGLSAILGSLLVLSLEYVIGFRGMIIIGAGFVVISTILTYRIDDKHIFNYAKLYPKEEKIYGETFTNKYGL